MHTRHKVANVVEARATAGNAGPHAHRPVPEPRGCRSAPCPHRGIASTPSALAALRRAAADGMVLPGRRGHHRADVCARSRPVCMAFADRRAVASTRVERGKATHTRPPSAIRPSDPTSGHHSAPHVVHAGRTAAAPTTRKPTRSSSGTMKRRGAVACRSTATASRFVRWVRCKPLIYKELQPLPTRRPRSVTLDDRSVTFA